MPCPYTHGHPSRRSAGSAKSKLVETVAPLFPVDEIAGVEDIYAGNGVHGGTGEIVVVADTQDIGVGKFIIEKGIGKGAVAVVGGP